MTLIWPAKFGDEVLDYEIDWSVALDGDDELSPNGVTAEVTGNAALEIDSIVTTGSVTKVWISGGGADNNASGQVEFLALTESGRHIGASVIIPVFAR